MIHDVLARGFLGMVNQRKCLYKCTLQRIFLIHSLIQERYLDSRPSEPSEGPSVWATYVKIASWRR